MNEVRLHTLLEKAESYEEDGKALHAMQVYYRLIGEMPSFDAPYLRLAGLLTEMRQWEKAERVLLQGHAQSPNKVLFLLRLGDLQLRRRRYSRAIVYFRRLEHRRIPQVHFSLGVAYMHLGDWLRAEVSMRSALMLDPRLPNASIALGEILLKRKMFDEAIVALNRGLEIDPYNSASHRLLGYAHLGLSRWEKALEEFILAVDMDPQDASGWQLCGETLVKLRRFEEAEPYLKKAHSLNPRSPDVSTSLGFLCLHRGDVESALAAFNEALKIDPGHVRALDGKLHIQIRKKQNP